jgi:hypothetical protein
VWLPWFDDAAWSEMIPTLAKIGTWTKALGFAGVAFDSEQYHQPQGMVDNSVWNYTGNTHTEAETRAQVRKRGGQIATALASPFPGCEFLDYFTHFPGGFMDAVQTHVNHAVNPFKTSVLPDLWCGIIGTPNVGDVTFLESAYYKDDPTGPAAALPSWQAAYDLDKAALHGYMTRAGVTRDRVYAAGFIWIDAGPDPSGWDNARPPEFVTKQLASAAQFGEGPNIGIYCYRQPKNFDYTPYVAGMVAASSV